MAYTSRKNNVFECGGQCFVFNYGEQPFAFEYGEQPFAFECGEQPFAFECGGQRSVLVAVWRIFGKAGQ